MEAMRKKKGGKESHFKWDLAFKDRTLEAEYLATKASYQFAVFKFYIIYIFLVSILYWAISPQPFQTWLIIFNVIKFFIVIAFCFLARRWPKHIQLMIILILVFLTVGIIENSGAPTGNIKVDLYFHGTLHGLFCFSGLLLKICWKKQFLVLIAQLGAMSFRYITWEEQIKTSFKPLTIFTIGLIFYTTCSFISEKQERKMFLEVKLNEKSLIFFQEFIQESLPLGVIVVAKNKIIYSNLESHKMFGIDGNQLKYIDLNSLILEDPLEDNGETDMKASHKLSGELRTRNKSLHEILKNQTWVAKRVYKRYKGTFAPSIISCNTKNGTKPIYSVNINKIIWKEEFATILLIAEDNSALKIEYLKEYELYKDRILASISHEFRTPINGIMGMLESVAENVLDPETQESLDLALKSSQRLLSLINNILDFSHMNLGKFCLNIQNFSLDETINEVRKLFEPEARRLGIDFLVENETEFSEPENINFRNDPVRFKQILLNFLSNSLKFTQRGFIKLIIKQLSEPLRVKITIEDTGCGIKEKMISNLFKFFGKIQDPDMKDFNTEGIGFGLAITQRLLSVMNVTEENKNSIIVKSQWGLGTSFTFVLESLIHHVSSHESEIIRLDELMGQDHIVETMMKNYANYNFKTMRNDTLSEFIPKSERKAKVLVVEDDLVNTLVLTRFLDKLGLYDYVASANGVEALEVIHRLSDQGEYFDLVLMDCNMPIMDGYQTTLEIRKLISSKIIPKLPIIAVTANVLKSELEKCLHCGMVDYLTKPFTREELNKKITKHLHFYEDHHDYL